MNYKFNEDQLIQEFKKYVDKTYDQHYATDKYQATDIIIDSGHGTGFCLGNVIKYAKRYGRKGNPDEWRKDVMKILHYALIQLYIHDQENKPANKLQPVCGVPSDYDLDRAPPRKAPGHFYPEFPIPTCPTSIDDVTPEEWDEAARKERMPLWDGAGG